MSITLSDGTTSVALHPDLYWADEYDWQPVVQTVTQTLTGAVIVQAAAMQAGRKITLTPADDASAWMTKSVVEQLRNWAAVAGKTLTLTLRGASRTVIFRHHDGGAMEATPVVFFSDADSDDWFRVTLRFMEV